VKERRMVAWTFQTHQGEKKTNLFQQDGNNVLGVTQPAGLIRMARRDKNNA